MASNMDISSTRRHKRRVARVGIEHGYLLTLCYGHFWACGILSNSRYKINILKLKDRLRMLKTVRLIEVSLGKSWKAGGIWRFSSESESHIILQNPMNQFGHLFNNHFVYEKLINVNTALIHIPVSVVVPVRDWWLLNYIFVYNNSR